MSEETKVEEGNAIGLNKKGFAYFVVLLLLFFPISFLPWLSKSLRGVPKGSKLKPDGTPEKSMGWQVFKTYAVMYLLMFSYMWVTDIYGHPGDSLRKETTKRNTTNLEKREKKSDYAAGYKAGYAYTKQSGKILTNEKYGNFEGRLNQMNKSMDGADQAVAHLVFSYGGNKSQAWKEGCREGYLEGLRGARSQY